jgi:hypothetical protein
MTKYVTASVILHPILLLLLLSPLGAVLLHRAVTYEQHCMATCATTLCACMASYSWPLAPYGRLVTLCASRCCITERRTYLHLIWP